MCISPLTVETPKAPYWAEVPCRYCWQCRLNRVNDLVGRCIAEQQMATATYAVTLTYAGDGPNTATLVYEDFQLFMKRLRRRGYRVRYIVAGEYGSKKGRAHWHAVLFFYGKAPQEVAIPDQRGEWDVILPRWDNDDWARIDWAPWQGVATDMETQLGFSYFQRPDYGGFEYAMKYSLKDQKQRSAKTHLAMSKKPPLGDAWFRQRAEQYVEQGLAPHGREYSFPHVFDRKGRRRKFMLQGKSLENFVEHYLATWERERGTPVPESEFLEAFQDGVRDILSWEELERAWAKQPRRNVRMPDVGDEPWIEQRFGKWRGMWAQWEWMPNGSLFMTFGPEEHQTWHVTSEIEKAESDLRLEHPERWGAIARHLGNPWWREIHHAHGGRRES
jgi:hypothetical protein